MAEISDYAKAALYGQFPSVFTPPMGYRRRAEMGEAISDALESVLTGYGVQDFAETEAVSAIVFQELLAMGAFREASDELAGLYYQFIPSKADTFRKGFLEKDRIAGLAAVVGERFFPDVFDAYLGRSTHEDGILGAVPVPASDRIVTVSHNQISEIDSSVDELISDLERDNGIPDHPGLKERLIGEVKAGRELLRAGTFKAYLFHITIIKALDELIRRYKGHAIAMVAASLVDLIVKNVLQVS